MKLQFVPNVCKVQESSPASHRGVAPPDRKMACASLRSGCISHAAGRAANAVLKIMPARNEFFWTKLISDHTKCGQGMEAIRIYKDMRQEGVLPKTYTFVAVLKACCSIADLEAGKEIHAHVIESGNQSHIFVATTLVDMYAKCGSMVDARQVFEKVPYRNVVLWNAMIMGYSQEAGHLALQLYARMQHEGFAPHARTFIAALKACISLAAQEEFKQVDGQFVKLGSLEKGRAIHSQVVKCGFESDLFVASTLVRMYVKCGSMVDARRIFEKMTQRDSVSWNAMILGYAQREEGDVALQLYARMQHEGFLPNAYTFVAALMACCSLSQQEGEQVDGRLVKIEGLEKGRAIHCQVAKSGLEADIFVASTLVDMYSKCGSMVDAHKVFERMHYHNVVSWAAMIMGYAQIEKGESALQFYEHMQHEGCTPNARTFVAALKACGSLAIQEEGKQFNGKLVKVGCLEKLRAIHSQVVKNGFEADIFIANTLVDLYGKCGSTMDAREVFEKMPCRTVVSWTAMITGYAQTENGELALQLYARMQQEGFTPNARTFVAALRACGSMAVHEEGNYVDGEHVKMGSLEKGRGIHSQVANSGFESDIFVANTLIDMYVKCGSIVDAHCAFEKMMHHDLLSWNFMIMGYVQKEEGELALQLYARMQDEGFTPDAHTFVAVLKACGSLALREEGKEVDGELVKVGPLEKGKAIHSEVAKTVFEADIFVANTLVDMYVKCGSMVDAGKVFEKMPLRDVVSWNAMIMGYAQREMGEVALQVYARMQHEGFTPDARTFVAALKACSSLAVQEGRYADDELLKLGFLEKGRAIHSQVARNGFESNIFVANTLVDMYAKCGSMVDACCVFEKMAHHDVVSWNAMIMGYAQRAEGELALQLYARMQHEGFMPDAYTFVAALMACGSLVQEGKRVDGDLPNRECLEKGRIIHSQVAKSGFQSDVFVANALLDMYAKCGSLVDACWVFENMQHRNVVSWNVMIMGYAQRDKSGLALHLYAQMQCEGCTPNARTFVAVLKACGSVASLETGKEIHAEIHRFGLENDAFVTHCLIDMYGKCGSMVDAQLLFDASPVRGVVTWNTLIAGYSSQGDAEHVFNLFDKMQQEGIWPVSITFASILTVCSHSGKVDKGQRLFQAMCSDYGVTPLNEHYSCMADLLGRSGQLEEAMAMVKKMPGKPDIVTWMSILGACQKWNTVEVGKRAFESAVRLDEKQAAAYVLMTNICVLSGGMLELNHDECPCQGSSM